jgi:hypothetical protein
MASYSGNSNRGSALPDNASNIRIDTGFVFTEVQDLLWIAWSRIGYVHQSLQGLSHQNQATARGGVIQELPNEHSREYLFLLYFR